VHTGFGRDVKKRDYFRRPKSRWPDNAELDIKAIA
jgi:hypothetical protein